MSTLEVHSVDPLCAGPDVESLVEEYVTPTDLHYIRDHGPVPAIDLDTYVLSVDGLVRQPMSLSLTELKERFPRHEITATLQCAGNRRDELDRIRPFTNEVMWSGDAIGTAVWAGAPLAEVVRAAEPDVTATHVWFEGLDQARVGEASTPFGASIELARALALDVLLAYEMNGEPLPDGHGAPLRVIVPGAIGARSVKWLGRVTLADHESENHFQRRSYRLGTDAIKEAPLNSYIASVRDGERVPAGPVRVSGYATAAGTAVLQGVEVRLDDRAWSEGSFLDTPEPGVWSRWEAELDLTPGSHRLSVRAHDSSGGSQQQSLEEAWNERGYLNNAIHTVEVRVERD